MNAHLTSTADNTPTPTEVTVTTSDPAELSTRLSQVYPDARVDSPPLNRVVDVRFQEHQLPGLWFANFSISTASMLLPENPFYSVLISTTGQVVSRLGGREIATEGHQCVVVSAGEDAAVDYFSDTSATSLRFAPQLVHDEIAQTLGRTVLKPIRFDPHPPVGTFRALESIMTLLRMELGQASVLERARTAHHLSRMAVSSLIHSIPSNYTEALAAPSGFTGPRPIRAAVEALEENPLEYASVSDLAREVALSVRALQDGFTRHVGTTPMRYRHRVRLERARHELIQSSPHDTTATAVAARWGFYNYGRFSADYRRQFGATPHQNLRAGETHNGT